MMKEDEQEDVNDSPIQPLKSDTQNVNFRPQVAREGCVGKRNTYDEGWSWAVLFGVSCIMMLNQLLGPSFGIMFGDYIRERKIQTSVVTWIFNFQVFIWNMFGFIVGPLCELWGWRIIAILGSLISAISIISTGFVSTEYHVFFSYSLLSGIGGSLTTTVCLFILPHYWKKRNGFANGVMMTGGCIGFFIFPQLIRFLQEKLLFRYSMITLGSLFLIGCIAGATFSPRNTLKSLSKRSSAPATTSFTAIGMLGFSSSAMSGGVAGFAQNRFSTIQTNQIKIFCNSFKIIRQLSASMSANIQVLKHKRAIIIAITASLVLNSYFNTLALIPIMIRDTGHSGTMSAWAISITAASSFIGRCVISAISDLKHFRKRKGILILIGIILLSLSVLGFSLSHDVWWLLTMMGFQGLGGGIVISLYPLIIIEYMGLDNLPATFGVASLFVGAGSITIGPCIGYVKDATDSYNISLRILSGIIFIGVILCLAMPWAQRSDNKSNEENDEKPSIKINGKVDMEVGVYRKSLIDG